MFDFQRNTSLRNRLMKDAAKRFLKGPNFDTKGSDEDVALMANVIVWGRKLPPICLDEPTGSYGCRNNFALDGFVPRWERVQQLSFDGELFFNELSSLISKELGKPNIEVLK